MSEKSKESAYLNLYRVSHNNAIDLLNEAEILFKAGCHCRAYALAFTALEEISKSQLAADVYTGLISGQEFQRQYRDHKAKIGRMAWATNDAERYLSVDGEAVEVRQPTFVSRNDSMYVNIKDNAVISPKDVIGKEDAESVMHTVNVALQQIFWVTEQMGHQIGTKGFMK